MTDTEPQDGEPQAERDARGHFLPGNQVRKGFRAPSTRARYKAALLSCCSEADLSVVGRKLVLLAKGGESWAIVELLNRLLGKPTARTEPLVESFEGLELASATQAVAAIFAAAVEGRISLDAASGLAAVADSHRRAIETEELAQKLEAIQRHLGIES